MELISANSPVDLTHSHRTASGYACRRVFDNGQLLDRFDKWLLICGMSPNTRIGYLEAAKQFAKFLLDRPLTSATKADVLGYVCQLYARNLAPATMSNRHFALRTFFHFLRLGDQVVVSPPHKVQTRKLPKRLPRAKSEEEMCRIITAADSPRNRAILELLYASGLRVNELAHLRVEDLSLDARTLRVNRGKGDKDRIALFGLKAARALRDYLGDRQTGPLFGITSRTIWRVVVQAAKRAGVHQVSPHTFRHSFATHLLNRGTDIRYVQELLGHTSLVATQKYLHVAIANIQRTHAQFHPRG
jgi:site-specific recombinase XerD